VFDIPTTWDRIHFKATRSKYRQARKLIEISINGNLTMIIFLFVISYFLVQFEKELKNLHQVNLDIEENINEINEHLSKHEKKVNIFDNLTEIASQSVSTHFDNVNILFHKKT